MFASTRYSWVNKAPQSHFPPKIVLTDAMQPQDELEEAGRGPLETIHGALRFGGRQNKYARNPLATALPRTQYEAESGIPKSQEEGR
jgi:hypothetical protein